MLQVLRDSMKYLAWILWVVIAVFVLFVFVDFGRSSRYGNGAQAQAAATVGNERISYPEFEHEYRQLEDQMRQQLGQQYSPELAEQLKLPMQALNRLVTRRILLQEAGRLKLQVSDPELRRYIVQLPVFQDGQGGFMGPAAYDQTVRRLGYTPDTFEQAMREQLLLQRLVSALQRSVVVSDAEVHQRYREQSVRAKIRYVAVPFAASVGQEAVPDTDLQRWYEEHKEQLKLPEQRVADYLLIDTSALQRALPLSDRDLRDYYAQHQAEYSQSEQLHARHILVDSEDKALAILDRLKKGEDFAAVARTASKDAGSAASGGDLGWFGRGRMVPAFEQAAFAAPVSQVVGPVKTQFGYHLIQVLEKKPGATTPFELVREAVRNRLAAERATQQAEARAKGIADELAKAGGNARQRMQELAKQPGVEFGTTEGFGKQGPIQPLGSAPEVNTAVFALPQGGVSSALRTPRGWVVLRLSDVKPPRVPALAEVREAVRRAVDQEKQRLAAFDKLQAARAKLGAVATIDAVASALGQGVIESPEFGAGGVISGLGYAPDLVKDALAKPVGAIGGPVAVAGSAVLYQVASQQGVDAKAFDSQKETLRGQMEQEQVNALTSSLINARKQELGVTYDPQLLKSFNQHPAGPQQG